MTKNILVMDDEELIIKSLIKLLGKTGYQVLVAKNGQEALAIVEEESIDLIVADIRMPGLNGVETICALYKQAEQKNTAKIPVIFITGYADDQIRQKAKTLKPVAYIYKPFDIQDLVKKIEEVLG